MLLAALRRSGAAAPAHLARAGRRRAAERRAARDRAQRCERRARGSSCSARSRSVIRRTRSCARSPRRSPQRPARRSATCAEGGNAVGARARGRAAASRAGGRAVATPGLNAREMLARALKAYVLLGASSRSSTSPSAERAARRCERADCVVALTPYADDELRRSRDVLLPIAPFAETSGTFVNVEGRWQSVRAARRSRWAKRGRAGRCCACSATCSGSPGFDYAVVGGSARRARSALVRRTSLRRPPTQGTLAAERPARSGVGARSTCRSTRVDALVRRAPSLQRTRDAQARAVARGGMSA